MKPLYDLQTIQQLIPQRPPIVEIDDFYSMASSQAVCGLMVRADNLLVEDNYLSEAGVLEHMAQSAAARAGYLAISRGEEVQLGFIGAVNNVVFMRQPHIGEYIATTVEVLETVMDIALVALKCHAGNELIAECRMKIFTKQPKMQQ